MSANSQPNLGVAAAQIAQTDLVLADGKHVIRNRTDHVDQIGNVHIIAGDDHFAVFTVSKVLTFGDGRRDTGAESVIQRTVEVDLVVFGDVNIGDGRFVDRVYKSDREFPVCGKGERGIFFAGVNICDR